MKLLVSTIAPYEWVKLDKQDKPVEKGQFSETAFLNTITKEITSVIGVAPANTTTFHSLDIPTKNRANMLAAVPFALEENLSEDIESFQFTIMDWVPGGAVQVAVIARKTVTDWVDTFSQMGVNLDAIVPEHALLPIHPSCEATIIKQDEDQYVVKTSAYHSFICDDDAFEYWWSDENNQTLALSVNDASFAAQLKEEGGENVNHWNVGRDFRAWLEHMPEQLKSAPSLLHGEFEPEHLKPSTSWLNIAAGFAACSLLLLGVSNWVEASRLQKRYDANQQEIRVLFDEAFPDQEYLDQPRRQIASLLSISEDNPASELFQYLLNNAASVVPSNNAKFEEINYRDDQLQIGVSAPNFAALENMTAQINAIENMQAALISSGTRGQRVTGQIKMARAQ